MLKLCKINACSDGTLGLHLSRAPWDPYPWVSGIQDASSAYVAGVRTGDNVLEVNGFDVIGQKISELAVIIRTHWNSGASHIQFLVWRSKTEQNTVNQQSLQKFATCLQNIAQLLECPICLEVVKPPGWQCCNGHVLCNSCRARTTKCSICRVTLGPRGRCLLSDKLFTLLAETFPCDVKKHNNEICGEQKISPNRPTVAIKDIKRRKQIVTIKVDFKSPQNKTSSCPDAVRYKNYHCPTGKSCVEPETNVPCNMSSEWDVLTHLRRVHQLSVTQHYGTYGERMQVQLMNKSISCISVVLNELHQPNTISAASTTPLALQLLEIPPTKTALVASSNGDVVGGILANRWATPPGGGGIDNGTGATGVGKISDVELFFLVRIPVTDGKGDGNVADSNVGNERCAIFVWYCGDEESVKKFQAVIECKRSGTKWKGSIHPLTKTWNSVQRQKEFLELKFDVSNSFDIVIKVK